MQEADDLRLSRHRPQKSPHQNGLFEKSADYQNVPRNVSM